MTIDADTIKSAEELFVDDRKRLRKVAQSPMVNYMYWQMK
jgi:hypothetical protein